MKAQVLFVFCVIACVTASTVPIHPSMFRIPNKEQSTPEKLPQESSNTEKPTQTATQAPKPIEAAPTAAPTTAPATAPAAQTQIHPHKMNIRTQNVRDGLIYSAGAMILKIPKRLPRAIKSESDDN